MNIPIDPNLILSYFLVLLRISALLFLLPFFSEAVIPVRIRLIQAVCMSIFMFHFLYQNPYDYTKMPVEKFIFLCLSEIFMGLVLGFASKLIFEGLIMSANLCGYQMGFGTANLLLPGTDLQINAFTALHRILVLLVFLGLDFHYIFINGLYESFERIPLVTINVHTDIAHHLIKQTAQIFVIALQLAAPILIALLFTMAGLGLMARTVPQLNVFTMSFPISFFYRAFYLPWDDTTSAKVACKILHLKWAKFP